MAPKTATKKTDAPAPAPAAAAAPIKEEVVAVAAPLETKAKKAKTASAAAAAVKEEVIAAPVAADVATAAPETNAEESALAEKSIEFLARLNQVGVLLSALKTEFRSLEKGWNKELKSAQKLSSKRKRKAGTRAPSGFVKPTKISDELAAFLGIDKGSEMARTDVTRVINKYIRTNNLQDKDNGRKINPDTKLATLLKLQKTDELTYFNIQRYMSIHFAKASANVAPVTNA